MVARVECERIEDAVIAVGSSLSIDLDFGGTKMMMREKVEGGWMPGRSPDIGGGQHVKHRPTAPPVRHQQVTQELTAPIPPRKPVQSEGLAKEQPVGQNQGV